MKQALRLLAVVLVAAAFAARAFAGDVLSDYQSRYTKSAFASAKTAVINELAATGKPEALKALQYCFALSKALIEDLNKDAEKARAKRAPVEEKVRERDSADIERQKKQGNPNPTTVTKRPDHDELLKLTAESDRIDGLIASEQVVVADGLDAHGKLVAKLPAEAQKSVRDDWTKNRLASKDWMVRAESYEILGHMPTDWALEMLVAAVSPATNAEPDPRALVVAVDSIAGPEAARIVRRDVTKVVPPLAARLDDARWLVRAAVLTALDNAPAKEGIDAIVKRMQKEDGRLKDDCARVLKSLTGNSMPANPEMWRVWWDQNREKWTGKPPPVDPSKASDPFADTAKADPNAKNTGFFGIEIESKRVVFVIDISGSMNSVMGGSGPEAKSTRAELARAELKRVVAALLDGSLFNIVFFSSGVHVWKPEVQKADAKTRKEALEYIAGVEFVGGTNTYDALEAAFALGDMGKGKKRESDPTGDARVDTIVFLSDGKPSVGKTTDPAAIRAAVKEWNKSRRIAIHAVAFGSASGKKEGMEGADPEFMKGLADDTGGKYVAK